MPSPETFTPVEMTCARLPCSVMVQKTSLYNGAIHEARSATNVDCREPSQRIVAAERSHRRNCLRCEWPCGSFRTNAVDNFWMGVIHK